MKERLMSMKLIFLCLGITLLLLTGCVTPGGLAPSTMPITANDNYTIVKHDASGTDTAMSILFIPINPCSAYNALQIAKEDNGADALINVTAKNKSFSLIVMSWEWITVYGDAIKFQREGAVLE